MGLFQSGIVLVFYPGMPPSTSRVSTITKTALLGSKTVTFVMLNLRRFRYPIEFIITPISIKNVFIVHGRGCFGIARCCVYC